MFLVSALILLAAVEPAVATMFLVGVVAAIAEALVDAAMAAVDDDGGLLER